MGKLLEIRDLHAEYHTLEGVAKVLNGVNLSIMKSEAIGLVGETGAGKTTTALSILGLLPKRTARITRGNILYGDIILNNKKYENQLQRIRGSKISMIFQNPLTSLNPVFTVGEQIAMVFRQHQNLSAAEAMKKAGELLEVVGIPAYRVKDFPHQFSGGMRQRVGIAAALVCRPDLLIADEPTTALDVTIQAQVLDLLKELQREYKTSLLMITHNLGIVAELCSKVAVMYAGEIIEFGTTEKVFRTPAHPYTKGLIDSLPDIKVKKGRLVPIQGFMPNPMKLPSGCRFHPRCPKYLDKCIHSSPTQLNIDEGHQVVCWNPMLEGVANIG